MRLEKALEGVDETIRLYEAGSIRDYNKTPSGLYGSTRIAWS